MRTTGYIVVCANTARPMLLGRDGMLYYGPPSTGATIFPTRRHVLRAIERTEADRPTTWLRVWRLEMFTPPDKLPRRRPAPPADGTALDAAIRGQRSRRQPKS